LGASVVNHKVCLDELSPEDGSLLSSQGVLMALGDEIGIIPLIAMLKSPSGLFIKSHTNHSIHVTITTNYFMNLELLHKMYTF
jgi:hypothetical protein